MDGQKAARSLPSPPPLPPKHHEEKIHAMVHIQNLKVGFCTVLQVDVLNVLVI